VCERILPPARQTTSIRRHAGELGTVTYFVSFPPSERGSVCERILPPPQTTSTSPHAGGWSSRSHSASLTPCSDLPRPVRIVPLVLPLCQGRHVHQRAGRLRGGLCD